MRNPTPPIATHQGRNLIRCAHAACYAAMGLMYLTGYHTEAAVGLAYLAMAGLVAQAHS